jgi:hypothetical protein
VVNSSVPFLSPKKLNKKIWVGSTIPTATLLETDEKAFAFDQE